jgi:hypothetical protein
MGLIRDRSAQLLVRVETMDDFGMGDAVLAAVAIDEAEVLRDVARLIHAQTFTPSDQVPVHLRSLGFAISGALDRGDLEAAEATALAIVSAIREQT